MEYCSQRVHRIVATAFHGEQPHNKPIVDHIDTNRNNNRPENLRWVTRLENILLNPITLKRIEYSYGSLDKFFKNPSHPIYQSTNSSFEWMRTVTEEESKNTLINLLRWSNENKIPKGGALGEWIYKSYSNNFTITNFKDIAVPSRTINALQVNWTTPCAFPNCPDGTEESTLNHYKQSLKKGKIFAQNDFGESIVKMSEIRNDLTAMYVICEIDNLKPFALAKVYIDENIYVHKNLGSFFQLDGAEKCYTLELGKTWEGGETFDELVS